MPKKTKTSFSLPKWPFYLGDMLLVAIALVVLFSARGSSIGILFSVLAVAIGAILFVIPFIVEYKDRVHTAILEQGKLDSEETAQIKTILSTVTELNNERAQQIDKNERSIIIFESLLKRLEARLESSSNITPNHTKMVEFEPEDDLDFDEMDIQLDMETSPEPEVAPTQTAPPSTAQVIANIQMGIGSKPFIRGEGGGLSWDTGTPMELESVGKWTWTSTDIDQPIDFKIYKDDQTPAQGPNQNILPGETQQIHPDFDQ